MISGFGRNSSFRKMGAPIVIGKGQNNISVSSDVLPFYGICSEVSYMRDGDVLPR